MVVFIAEIYCVVLVFLLRSVLNIDFYFTLNCR